MESLAPKKHLTTNKIITVTARISPIEQALIEDMIKNGIPLKQIAKQQGRARSNIRRIRNKVREELHDKGVCISGTFDDMLEDIFGDDLG